MGFIHCFRKVRRSLRIHQVVEVVCTQIRENEFLARCRSRWTQARWCLEVSICIIHTWCSRCSPTQVSRHSSLYKLNKRLSWVLILLSTRIQAIISRRMECLNQSIHPVSTRTSSTKCTVFKATHRTALNLQKTIWNRNRKTSKWAISFRTTKSCRALPTWRSW